MADTKYTVSFNDDTGVKGWTSFHSFHPDWMIGLNNSFYSFKDGNLYVHYSKNVPRGQYYGEVYPSKISVMLNASPSDIKELQAVSLEGNFPWSTEIKAYVSSKEDFTASSIMQIEYLKKEGIWYAYARRNEDPDQVDSKSMYGIGSVTTIAGNSIIVNGFSSVITIGDKLLNADLQLIGTIESYTIVNNITTIQLDTVNNAVIGSFVLGSKNVRIEGGNLRGYTIRFDLEITEGTKVELFALNGEVIKSFP